MKENSKTVLVGTILVMVMVVAVGLCDYTLYHIQNPLIINITNASDSDMPIEIYLDGELVDTGLVEAQGCYTYEQPKKPYDFGNHPSNVYTVSIRAPNTIYEREDQGGTVFFVLD